MDLNTTQNFLETHTHSEFWFLKSRGQNKPNLGLVHVLLAHTAPNRCSPALPSNPTRSRRCRFARPIGSRRRRSLPLATRPNPTRSSAPTPPPSSWFPPPSPPRHEPAPGPALPPPSRRCASGRGRPRPSRPPSRRSTSPRWPRRRSRPRYRSAWATASTSTAWSPTSRSSSAASTSPTTAAARLTLTVRGPGAATALSVPAWFRF